MPGDPALIRFCIHQNDIRTDPADAIPGNHKVVPMSAKTKKPAGTGHDDRGDPSLRQLQAGIANKPQPPAVADADHLFVVQI